MPDTIRKRKAPARFSESGDGFYPETVRDMYRYQYLEVCDSIVSGIQDRFNQKGYEFFMHLEKLFFEAAKGNPIPAAAVSALDGYLIDFDDLSSELCMLPELMKGNDITLVSIISTFQSLSSAAKSLYRETIKVLKLLLLLPATNAVSERCFSHLRLLKNYLRNSMTQRRLNHMMLIYTHRDVYRLDSRKILNIFIDENYRERSKRLAKC